MQSNSDKQAQKEKSAKKTSREIHKGRIIKMVEESYILDGKTVLNDLVLHPGAVAIVPIDDKDNILLIKQWRRAIQQVLIEIPAGTLEDGEDVKDCAMREIREETGFRAKEITYLGLLHTCPGFCTETIDVFLAKDLIFDPLPPDEHEAIDVLSVTLDEALKMIDIGQITDAKTISAIGLYLIYKQKHKAARQ